MTYTDLTSVFVKCRFLALARADCYRGRSSRLPTTRPTS